MKKVRFLRFSSLEDLRSAVHQNLATYRSGDFGHLVADTTQWFEFDTEIDQAGLSSLLKPAGQDLFEPHNSVTLYEAMKSVSPYEARDERLWAYLTHTELLEYTRSRWIIPADDDEAIGHIQKHFFARDKRQVERDNAASRLWWMAHLCARVESLALEDALKALLFRSDVRANIVERPTTSQSVELFSSIVERLALSLAGKQALFERETFRSFMREINSVGGFKLLDCLNSKQIDSILDGILVDRLQLANL